MKRGKKYLESAKLRDSAKLYETAEAMDLVIKGAKAKFDETVEIHVKLGVDSRHADQQVRGAVVLPHGTGKTTRVLVFAKGDKAEEAKEIIQKLLVSLSDDDKDLSQIVNIIKNNINDIKMFNKFSDEYYYFNFPVNFNKNEYPCKLIIKDNRKEGKKLDSKNIKLALNVNTKHFNDVDAFVKVINKSMDIEISCDEKYIKVFEVSKENLKNTLESIGFLARISVSKKKYDLDLTACRDFFGENNVAGVDIKV